MKGYEYQSDFAKKHFEQGLAEGRAEAYAEARVEQAARSLLIVLRARGIAVSQAVRERIQAQKDLEQLRRWVEKAALAPSADEIFAEPT